MRETIETAPLSYNRDVFSTLFGGKIEVREKLSQIQEKAVRMYLIPQNRVSSDRSITPCSQIWEERYLTPFGVVTYIKGRGHTGALYNNLYLKEGVR